MKRLALALALASIPAVTLPACQTVANRTTLDEKAGLAVEVAYTAAARAAALAIRAGLISGAQIEPLRQRARAAVLSTRAAYDTGNAADYASAAANALELISQLTAMTGDR